MTPDPRTLYIERLAERRVEIAHQEQRHRTLGHGKLAMAVCGVALVWLALARNAFSILWVLIPAAGFVLLVVIHEKLLKVLERRRRAARFFEKALARLDGNWAGTGEAGDRYSEAAHPYALDLDLFGKGSVFELLCTARTRIGEDRLAGGLKSPRPPQGVRGRHRAAESGGGRRGGWLKPPATPEVVRARHRAVEELRERVDLREELAIVAEEARSGVDPVHLAHWGEAPGPLPQSGFWLRVRMHTVLGLAGFAALWIHLLRSANLIALPDGVDALVRDLFLVALVVNGWFLYRQSGVLGAAVSAVEEAAHELGLLAEVLVGMEREPFRCPLLAAPRESLDAEGAPPSRQLARHKRLVENLDSRDNVFVRVLEPFILWTPHLALQVEDWRALSGGAVRRWLNAAGDMEALCSLASHAFEHPADTFPEFAAEGPWIDAQAIGHPLLAEDKVVRNDIRIGGALRVIVVSEIGRASCRERV